MSERESVGTSVAMKKHKLSLRREVLRQLTAVETHGINAGHKVTDGSNATKCLAETVPGSCQDNTFHFCQ